MKCNIDDNDESDPKSDIDISDDNEDYYPNSDIDISDDNEHFDQNSDDNKNSGFICFIE